MFENVLGQPATNLLCEAIKRNNLAPALLFIGPDASAKLTTALETARVLSCEGDGSWTCMCDSCKRHKDLAAADILIMGTRDTVLETKAAARVLCTHKTPAARYLFARAVRKLTSRFDARLWDTDELRFLKAYRFLLNSMKSFSVYWNIMIKLQHGQPKMKKNWKSRQERLSIYAENSKMSVCMTLYPLIKFGKHLHGYA